MKEKEDADATKAKEERQKELEEARKVAELKKKKTHARKVEEERQKELEEARKTRRHASLGKAGTFRGRGSNKRSRKRRLEKEEKKTNQGRSWSETGETG